MTNPWTSEPPGYALDFLQLTNSAIRNFEQGVPTSSVCVWPSIGPNGFYAIEANGEFWRILRIALSKTPMPPEYEALETTLWLLDTALARLGAPLEERPLE